RKLMDGILQSVVIQKQ
ncbi:DUF769 domain-containing protein, partial [Xylella fastidiosa]